MKYVRCDLHIAQRIQDNLALFSFVYTPSLQRYVPGARDKTRANSWTQLRRDGPWVQQSHQARRVQVLRNSFSNESIYISINFRRYSGDRATFSPIESTTCGLIGARGVVREPITNADLPDLGLLILSETIGSGCSTPDSWAGVVVGGTTPSTRAFRVANDRRAIKLGVGRGDPITIVVPIELKLSPFRSEDMHVLPSKSRSICAEATPIKSEIEAVDR